MTPSWQVVIRVDAGRGLGAGHLMRTLHLAAELRRNGAEVTFAGSIGAGLTDRVTTAGHRHVHVVSDPSAATAGVRSLHSQRTDARRVLDAVDGPVAVVVDHYGLDRTWDEVMRAGLGVTALAVIDDLADRPHDADLLVDQNWYGPGTSARYEGLVPPSCELLLGPRYALLDVAYRAEPPQRSRSGPRRAVISFGGTDSTGASSVALAAFTAERFESWHVDVVVGSPDAATDELRRLVARRPRTELHVAVPSLAPFYRAADVAVGAGGSATWERLACGVPAVVATTSELHSGVSRQLDVEGATTWLGVTAEVAAEDYARAIDDLVLRGFPTPPRLVDGWGAARVANLLTELATGRTDNP